MRVGPPALARAGAEVTDRPRPSRVQVGDDARGGLEEVDVVDIWPATERSSGPLSCHCQVSAGAGVQSDVEPVDAHRRSRPRRRRRGPPEASTDRAPAARARRSGAGRPDQQRAVAARRAHDGCASASRATAGRARGRRARRRHERAPPLAPASRTTVAGPQRLGLDPLRRRSRQRSGREQRDHRFAEPRHGPAARVDDPRAAGADRERGREAADAREALEPAGPRRRATSTSPRAVSSTSTRVARDRERARRSADLDRRALARAGARREPRDGAVAAVGHPHRAVADGDVLRVAPDRQSGARSRRPRAGRSATPSRRPS